MNLVYFSLGSNIGDKRKNLKNAIELLKKNNVKILKMSSIYETEPVCYKNQPYFYNACIKTKTTLKPLDLLCKIKKIEKQLGRVKTKKWGPRIIDIDILFYNNIIFKDRHLIIPHPEIVKRNFILIPLYEIEKNFIHPEKKLKIKDLINLNKLKDKVIKIGDLNDSFSLYKH
ncbi:MAG TPA: 2-amino-4-hydroxy-6-hydroxymethyldihydropteridine diphosphokinase [Candidatus Goldiibacteriota bacterium]|nr:2-amino-4-hydroxy-6-hydroxymethyldihydropteridine diphosphokinase [Candidatus Goldiibacteriota bacterium]